MTTHSRARPQASAPTTSKFIDVCKVKCTEHFTTVIVPSDFPYLDFSKPKMIRDISLGVLKDRKFVHSDWPVEYSVALLLKKDITEPTSISDYEIRIHLY